MAFFDVHACNASHVHVHPTASQPFLALRNAVGRAIRRRKRVRGKHGSCVRPRHPTRTRTQRIVFNNTLRPHVNEKETTVPPTVKVTRKHQNQRLQSTLPRQTTQHRSGTHTHTCSCVPAPLARCHALLRHKLGVQHNAQHAISGGTLTVWMHKLQTNLVLSRTGNAAN